MDMIVGVPHSTLPLPKARHELPAAVLELFSPIDPTADHLPPKKGRGIEDEKFNDDDLLYSWIMRMAR